MGVATPKPPLTIHPHSKLCGILAIFHKTEYSLILNFATKEIHRRNHEKIPPHTRFEYIGNSFR